MTSIFPKWSQIIPNHHTIIPKRTQNDPKWSRNDPNMIPKPSQYDPTMITKWSQNDHTMITRWAQNDHKMIPRWSQNYPKMIAKWSQIDPTYTHSTRFRHGFDRVDTDSTRIRSTGLNKGPMRLHLNHSLREIATPGELDKKTLDKKWMSRLGSIEVKKSSINETLAGQVVRYHRDLLAFFFIIE